MAVWRYLAIGLMLAASSGDAPAGPMSRPETIPEAAAPAPGKDPVAFARLLAQFENLSDKLASSGHVVGLAVAVVHDGKVVSLRGLGQTSADGGTAVGEHTVFRIASLSKGIAATYLGLLVDAGFVGWDDAVQPLVPAFELSDSRQSERVTVRDLVSHRVGLPYNSLDRMLERDEPYPLLVYHLREIPLTCAPGDCYAYQNIAYSLIGDVAFATTGRFFSYEVERRVFHPLGMDNATYGRDALESSGDWARPHVRARRSYKPIRAKETYYRVLPAAGVNASISDMAQWALAQLGHRPDVLSASLLDALHSPQVSTPGETSGSRWRRERVRAAQYALGFRVYDYSGHRVLFHGGAVQGYRAAFAVLPEHDLGVVILWNNESGAPSGLLPTLFDRYLGLPTTDWLGLEGKAMATTPARKPGR